VAVFAQTVPACPDLLTVGLGTVIRKDATISCYRALAGVIQLGPVTLGRDVVVGEAAVLDVGTSMGDGAQLGHASSLYPGQAVPAGERWHGSPGRPTDVDYRGVEGARLGLGRRFLYPLAQLVTLLAVVLPLALGGSYLAFTTLPRFATLLRPPPSAFTTWAFYREALAASYLLFVAAVLAGLVVMFVVPRLLNLFLVPDKVYRLYGFHYWVHRTITRLTNRSFYTRMFGDSSYIVGYLRGLGYRLRGVQQTGSNFGTEVKQDNPFLSSAGSGTVIADGLSVVNTSYSSGTFRVSRTSIGAHNFLGNRIVYPSGGRTGDNCLLATKVLVPIDGEVREGVGLLGSPSFEIPRSVERDNQLDVTDPAQLDRLLADKNRHNLVSIGLYLLVRWIYLFAVLVIELVGVHVEDTWGVLSITVANVVVLLFTVGYYLLVDRLFRGLMALRPTGCSIYDPAFWRHERFWKVCADQYLHAFNGTPFKNVLWRLLGVRFGRRVFDDGAFFTERRFVTIGDHCTLNAGSVVQCHSQEDGAFKSDHSAVGAGGTLGVNAFVHYGVTIGQRAVLAADSFLMKGEEIPDGARWGGNPAREIRS
jgi:non-ribosomal peptide synthetase-like protein